MSDFRQDYHPGASPAATARTAAAATGFATTLYDRLNTADANSQYLWGTQQLKKSMTDFNNSLLTNNDYSGYVDKMKSADQSSFDSVMSKITNPSAKEKLNQEWQTMSTDHYDQVSTLATKQKVAAIDGRYVDSWNSVVDSSSSAAEKKQELKGIYDSWLSAGTRDKVALARQLGTAYAQIDSQDAYAQGLAKVNETGNLEDGIKVINDYSGLNDAAKGTIEKKLQTDWNLMQTEQAKQWAAHNNDVVTQAYQAFDEGKWSPQARDQFIGTLQGHDRMSYVKALQGIGKGAEAIDQGLSNQLLISSYNDGKPVSDADRLALQAQNTAAFGAQQITKATWDSVNKMLDPKSPTKTDPVLAQIAGSVDNGISLKDPSKYIYQQEKASFLQWAQQNPNATRSEQREQASMFRQMAAEQTTIEAVKQLHFGSGQNLWQHVIGSGGDPIRTAIEEFGGEEISQMAKAGDPAALHIQQLAAQDFVSRFRIDPASVKVVPISPTDPGDRTALSVQASDGSRYALAYFKNNKKLSWYELQNGKWREVPGQ